MIFPEMAKSGTTQQVTARDVAGGRIRIPSTGLTKQLLPGERTEIELVLNGKPIGLRRYDPRLGPDRERSGVISVPRAVLEATVTIGDRLPVVRASNGTVYVGERGSKLRIAQWVNERPDEFNACLKQTSLTLADFLETREPRWRSPLRADGYAEFSDDLWT